MSAARLPGGFAIGDRVRDVGPGSQLGPARLGTVRGAASRGESRVDILVEWDDRPDDPEPVRVDWIAAA